jgi:hypothetical protein
MSCYECGRYGHKKAKCPNKVIKCYGCGVVGHYKDKCPVLLEQQKIKNDCIWFEQNMPDVPLQTQFPISNLQEVKNFLGKHPNFHHYVKIGENFTFTINNMSTINAMKTDALGRAIANISLDEFALFLQRKQMPAKVCCTKYGNTLEKMVDELSTAGIVTTEKGNRIKFSCKYYIGNIHVKSLWDERGWESMIPDGVDNVIIDAYKLYKGNNYDVIEDMKTYTATLDFKICA